MEVFSIAKSNQFELDVMCRLFVIPQYCGTLLEQSLLLNRRRNNFEDMPKSKRSASSALKSDHNTLNVGAGVDDSASVVESVISESEKLRIREGVHTRIYVCATMWHETANEMVQVLKSIMRLSIFLFSVISTLKELNRVMHA
jgi:chitin synthase